MPLSLLSRMACTMLLVCLFAFPAMADASSYAVLPFKINGAQGFQYLSNAIPSMLNSKLYREEYTQPLAGAKKSIKSASELEKVRAELKADYVFWGEVSITGDDAQMKMFARGKNGKDWSRTGSSSVRDLPVTLQKMADAINTDIFGRTPDSASAYAGGTQSGKAVQRVNQMNSQFVHNETTQRQVYLNPQFRYQGNDGTRLRSQSLPFASLGMEVADFDGDGKSEIALLSKDRLFIYRWTDQGLRQIGEYKLPKSLSPLLVRSIDLDRDRAAELIISAYDGDYTEPQSILLSFRGGKVTVLADHLPWYLNVVRLPPAWTPMVVGQKGDPSRIFSRAGVHEMMREGRSLAPARRIDLPKDANALNFVWLPGKRGEEGEKLIVLNGDEKLRVFGPGGSAIYLTDEKFSGSAIGIAEQTTVSGLGKSNVLIPSKYFIPLRMIASDLEKDGSWEIMVNKPISVTAQYFGNYRNFPESEIQTLFWDGVGLSLMWKTRRIKGSVVDFALADPNNDRVMDLVAAVNTHPGALGIEHRKTTVVLYPLDLSKIDPKTAPVLE